MYLNRDELLAITNVMNQFPDCHGFRLEQDTGSGIGNITYLIFDIEVKPGIYGEFKMEISGVDKW